MPRSGFHFGDAGHAFSFLFGSTTGVLIIAMVVVLAISLYLGLQDRVTLRIGLRNFVRGGRRTLVLLLGLLIGTAIISSSLVIGDTVNTLTTHFVYISDGKVNEAVYTNEPDGSYAPVPYSFFSDLNNSMENQSGVQGLSPLLFASGDASGLDLNSGVPQTGMNLIGTDANTSSVLGYFTSTGGSTIPGPTNSGVLLDPTAATDLDAKTGDTLNLVGTSGKTLQVTVLGLVQADTRGGFEDSGTGNVFTSLADAQMLLGLPGQVNYIAVTNVQGGDTGVSETQRVMSELNTTVPQVVSSFPAGTLPSGLSGHNILQDDLLSAESSASTFTTIFLVVGLFSIVSGSILVVGIFVLLAEERRGQMGVARAIGMRRRQLVKSYYFEGLAYSAGSALIGTILGVGIALLLMELLSGVLAPGTTATAVLQSFTVLPSTLFTAYVIGFLLTLGTMIITVWYIGRLNIVRAIRNLPEPALTRKSYLKIGILGVLVTLLGLLLVHEGLPTSVDLDIALLGTSLTLIGVALVATAVVPVRYTMTAAGLALIVFWGDYPLRNYLFGTGHPGDVFVFFQEGIFLILGAILLYLFNSDLVMKGISRLVSGKSTRVPVVRVAFSYPAHKRFRTAMTLAIFAMVLFTIVAVASIGSGITTSVDGLVEAQSGGYTMFGASERPINGIAGDIWNNTTIAPKISTVIPFYSNIGLVVGGSGKSEDSFYGDIAAAPTGMPPDENFYTSNHYNFSVTEGGIPAGAVWNEMETNESVAVLSGNYYYSGGGLSFGAPSSQPHISLGEEVNISTFGERSTLSVHVIGFLSESTISAVLVNPEAMLGTLRSNHTSLFLITTSAGANPQVAIDDLKRAFYPEGLQLLDFEQIFAAELQFTVAFLDLLEVFVTLGLVVGIAAIGILSLRAVVERRSEIGMIRALGFTKRRVLITFLIEFSFLALLGIAIGTILGILLSYNISEGISGMFTFTIPWDNIILVVLLSYGLTLLATGGPAYAASKIPPAEALRYSE